MHMGNIFEQEKGQHGHSNSICWFTSKDDDDYGPGGRNKIVNVYPVIAMNMINLQLLKQLQNKNVINIYKLEQKIQMCL